ncbi:unnamed protein product [Gordionus sp. m RMFG-2023]
MLTFLLKSNIHTTNWHAKVYRFIKPDLPQWKLINESKLQIDHVDNSTIRKPYLDSQNIKDVNNIVKKILSIEYGKEIRRAMQHMEKLPYDKYCRWKTHLKIGTRRDMLTHLRKTNFESYQNTCATLGITWQKTVYPPRETYFNKAIREANERARDIIHDKMQGYKQELESKRSEFFERKNRILNELEKVEQELENLDVVDFNVLRDKMGREEKTKIIKTISLS